MASKTTHSTTVRLNPEFYRRVKFKLAADGETFQSKVQALLEEYVDGPAIGREEIQRQVAVARAAMRRSLRQCENSRVERAGLAQPGRRPYFP
jgi:hypothetical protein